ncbi:MAG TPA: hypothetical protein VHE12_09015 [bacterium]|nr:hypothetical protein [bacterium]
MAGVLGAQADPVTPIPFRVSPTLIPGEAASVKRSPKPRNRKKIVRDKPSKTPTPSPSPTATGTPGPTVTPGTDPAPSPTRPMDAEGEGAEGLARVFILSDPVRGKKAIFRIVAKGPAKALVRIYDRTFNKVADLQGEGTDLFDILWMLKKVPEGIYHFQSQVILGTGEVVTPELQDFTVEKEVEPSND